MSLSLFLVSRGYLGEINGIKRWATGLLFQCLGWIIGGLFSIFPDFTFLVPISTTLLLLSTVFYYHALLEFKESNYSIKWAYQTVCWIGIVLLYFDVVFFNINIRLVISSSFGFLVTSLISRLLLLKRYCVESSIPLSHKITGYIFALCAVVLCVRVVYFYTFPPANAQELLKPSVIQDVTYLAYHLVISTTSFSFLLMCSDKYIALQKQGLIKLQASEARFRKIIDMSPVPMALYDGENLVLLNEVFTKTLGYHLTDIPTVAAWRQKAYPDPVYRQWVIDTWLKIQRNKMNESGIASMPQEVLISCKDGTQKTMIVSATTIPTSADGLYLGVLYDISERKLLEQELVESSARIQDLYDCAPCGYHSLDKDGFLTQVNETELKWLGYSKDEVVGKMKITDFFTNEGKLLFQKSYPKFIEQGHIENLDFDLIHKDGSIRKITVNATAITDANGHLASTRSVLYDSTERQKSELALAESEFRWKFAIEGSGDGLWDWNVQTGKVFFTKRWKEMLGFDETEIGENVEEWEKRIHPDDKPEVMEIVQNYFDGKIPVYISEHRVLCKDGTYKWILDRGIVVQYDEDGHPLRMIGTHTDISKQKQTEERLQQLVDQERCWRIEQSQFMAMLAHELKTPLSVVRIALGSKMPCEETLLHANRAVSDMNNVIERCLQSEKITDQKLAFQFSDCDILNLLTQLHADVQPLKRLVIHAQSVPLLHTDTQLLHTILLNLIDNALKYSPPNSVVQIEVQSENEGVSVSIENLIGIAGSPDMEKVFQKYYRNKAAHHRTGSGLGLYLVKSLTTLLGGHVDYHCDDTHVMFTLWLPIKTDA